MCMRRIGNTPVPVTGFGEMLSPQWSPLPEICAKKFWTSGYRGFNCRFWSQTLSLALLFQYEVSTISSCATSLLLLPETVIRDFLFPTEKQSCITVEWCQGVEDAPVHGRNGKDEIGTVSSGKQQQMRSWIQPGQLNRHNRHYLVCEKKFRNPECFHDMETHLSWTSRLIAIPARSHNCPKGQ
jgi:hypothetical protein